VTGRPKLIHVTTVDLSLHALLSHQLGRFREDGFEVAGASAPGPYVTDLAAAGIRHIPVPALSRSWTPGKDLRAAAQLYRLFRRERPDIVHTHNPKSGFWGRVAARAARVPVVVNTVHGLYANPSLPPLRRALIRTAERLAARLSHHELFQSEEDYRLALRSGMVPASRATVLGNGVDLGRFDPAAVDPNAVTALRRGWGAGEGRTVVGTVGRLVAEKGYRELFEAAARIGARRQDVVFVVVGPQEPTKADRISEPEIERARGAGIVFHGEERDMPAVYAAFDMFLLASHREGVPRSAIEASAMARPVVATDIRGCREVVLDGVTGLLVRAGDVDGLCQAVLRLLDDPAAAGRMGAAGRDRAMERFDEEAVVRRTLEVYRRLLESRR
jgi:glycosyltransferase involved in cell wall biosynthesis